jgi:hypothetical protein
VLPFCWTKAQSTGTEADIIKTVRLIHLYLGVFIAPAVLFFAFTGILQTFSLHENSKDGTYAPPAWVLELAQLHKKQTLQLPERKPQPAPGSETGRPDAPKKAKNPAPSATSPVHDPLPMKVFFSIIGIGLVFSTITGLYMSYKYGRRKLLLVLLFLAGIVIPVLLTAA